MTFHGKFTREEHATIPLWGFQDSRLHTAVTRRNDQQELGPMKPGVVAHACNPSYSGGGDWEDQGSRVAWANSKTSSHPIKAGCGGSHLSSQL
jgi:hypothetical protein